MKKLLIIILITLGYGTLCSSLVRPVPENEMYADSNEWTGFFRLKEREMTLGELIKAYGAPAIVGKGAYIDYVSPDGDTLVGLYELVFKDLEYPDRVLRYEWNGLGRQDLVLFFDSDRLEGKPLGGYSYNPHTYQISDWYHEDFFYSPRNWDHEEGCIRWDTITKSQDWVSFRYFADKDLNPDTISKKLGKPRWIKTGKDAKGGLYYSTYRLEGMYSQSFAKYPEDSITRYTWETDDYFYLEIYYINTENGDSAITGCFQSSMVLPE